MAEKKLNISYKEFDKSNLEQLFSNEKLLKDLYFVKFGEPFKGINKKVLESSLHDFFKKQYSTFIILNNNKVIGFTTGVILDKTFISVHTYVHKDYQGKGVGKKLIFRKLAYLIHKKGIINFQNPSVKNNKIYSINEAFVNRKSLSENATKKYKAELKQKKETYINSKTKEKRFKNSIVIKRPK
ncbi:MAG: GNAT family N-acetyltransferase [archaeon]|jgi:GNAT superfamily N-acetyltransferase|nr:GNAT family N-acetyltransferase [archaeon]MDD2477755.1 GNAT family N-acetyltransferase [Candidatus ainarchaeum sp.]MDD3084622.1 GNAT family N-acetyltransferase [Candidatus ainarchaeum sp.]MDD4221332.1 GNAT family N-acetyltransferase [Candidatus ainarchaeum sp.]MDD4662841.1 GNAT family N-acetyltransferase [Candidatus ainarchaeum sp.]